MGDQLGQFELPNHVEDGLNVTIWQRAQYAEVIVGGNQAFPLEDTAEALDLFERQLRDVGQRPVLDLPILPIAFAEQIGGG